MADPLPCFGCFVTQSSDRTGSLGVILLRDLRDVFGTAERLPTEVILDRLHLVDESPWADLRGKELDARGLARRLAKYGVKPKVYRDGDRTIRGYQASDLMTRGVAMFRLRQVPLENRKKK